MKEKKGWDMELDFKETYRMLLKRLYESRRVPGERGATCRLYLIILLTQLRNGSRVGESVRFLEEVVRDFLEAKKLTAVKYIEVEKQTKNPYRRRMVLPGEVTRADISAVGLKLLERLEPRQEEVEKYGERVAKKKAYKRMVVAVSTWARKVLGINTHSLRFAFITYLSRQGYPPQVISKITGHRNLNYLIHYTEERAARDILDSLKI